MFAKHSAKSLQPGDRKDPSEKTEGKAGAWGGTNEVDEHAKDEVETGGKAGAGEMASTTGTARGTHEVEDEDAEDEVEAPTTTPKLAAMALCMSNASSW